ncbi:hypothetical protein PHYPSEUDO_011901 [Phytophthora pseudosyringae]|uniref:No apical meristem-associated C-terminal domain-containing protein n=1 Tax=Phytophthora pseudosyringae TaxID=221518 RepID=A0A8T1W7L2_9STRA|nr:hypothetical protein PHYPSEUDO_011901 [Phytophthora pseudosyringae]
MGKKTNWKAAEDQTLCRVWLSASDLQLQGGDQKASNFWGVVLELFHQEMEAAVERPLNGLKVRWTRINRDSQKFSCIFNEIQSKNLKQTEEIGGDSGDAAAVALLAEQQWIEDAKDVFRRMYNAKFSFEACWKQLRYSHKWLQLFANSSNNPVLIVNSLPTPPMVTTVAHGSAARSPSSTSSEQEITTMDDGATASPSAPTPAALASPPRSRGNTESSVAAAAVSQALTDSNVPPSHKRRADVSLESFAHTSSQQQELQGLTATLVEELKRQNELMEDQNAIALLKVDGEMIPDAEARHCYQLLRARYLKKPRTNHGYSRTSTLLESKSMGAKDVAAGMRRYWGSDHEYNDEELFAVAQRQWEASRGSDSAAQGFVLQMAACRLEEQLLTWLLQSCAADAAEDIQMLVAVCTDPYFTTGGLDRLESTLDALLTAAVARAAACDRNAENRKRRMAEIVATMGGGMFVKSQARQVLRVLEKCETTSVDAAAWTSFLKLPSVLDPRVFNSRSGRAFMDVAGPVIALQQAELNAVRGSVEDCGNVEMEGEGLTSTANILWRLATQILELLQAKPASRDNTEATAGPKVDSALVLVENVVDVEGYLKAKALATPTCVDGSSDDEISLVDDREDLSAIEQLSNICSSSDKESTISRDILETIFDKLSAIKSLHVISIQASFLLGMQMRLKCCFVDHCESAKDEFERRIRRVFNRLTGKAQDLEHVAALVILAAFCPGQVIQLCIRGARTDVLHHSLYLKALRASPLLLDWREETGDGTGASFERELQKALLDISSNQSNFDRESQNVLSFLMSLVGLDSSVSSKRGDPVMTITKLLDGVINPVCCYTCQTVEMQLNLLTLSHQLFQYFVTANAGLDIDPAGLETSFNLALEALYSSNASDPRLRIRIHEKLLLLLKSTMELMSDPASMITLEQFDTPLSPSLWTLISLFNSELGNDELCNGLADVATLEAYLHATSVNDPLAPLPLPNVISAIQVLLWGSLWDSTLSENVSVESTKSETWKLLDVIARYEFSESNSVVETIKGNLLIQSAVAEMMLECGSVLFQALFRHVIPYLLEYEPTEISQEDWLTIPKWATGKISEQPEISLQIPCRLVSIHSIMRYVAKCWGLSGAINMQLATPSNVLLVESFSHVLVAHDQAITSSQGSLSRTLFCIQWMCLLVSTACDLRLDTVRTQLELSLLRLLHQLELQEVTSTAEAHFSQYFVAAWLTCLPAGKFEQVFNFLATRTNI